MHGAYLVHAGQLRGKLENVNSPKLQNYNSTKAWGQFPLTTISINDSTLASVCYTVIYMVRVELWLG